MAIIVFFLLAFDVIYPSLRLLPLLTRANFVIAGTLVGGFMWEYVINLLMVMDTKLTGAERSSLY